ncbi:MAG: hypothetical protein V9E88_13085 [Ferruginibacter sp.]
MLAVQMIETGCNVAGHLQMLNLILADRHLVCLEHQNVRRHRHRIAKQTHRHALVWVLVGIRQVLSHRRLVSMGAIHQALRGDAGDHPGQFQDLRNVGLGVEDNVFDIQPQRQPGRRHFQPGTMHQRRVLTLDQGVIVGQKVERLHVLAAASLNRGQNRANIVAQMRSARGGNASQSNFHG